MRARVAVLFAILGGPAAWGLHLVLSYGLVTLACQTGWQGAIPALVITTALCGGIAVVAGLAAYRRYRRVSMGPGAGVDREDTAPLMVIGGALAALFLFIIVLGGLIPLFAPTCR